MKQYIIAGVLTLSLILLIAGTTYLTLKTVTMGDLSILSIDDMKVKDTELDTAMLELEVAKLQFNTASKNLESAKKMYFTAKDAYDNISETKIERIKEATKEEHYYLDWLWIVLGEYADANSLALNVIDSRSVVEVSTDEETSANRETPADVKTSATGETSTNEKTSANRENSANGAASANGTIKIKVVGRYADIANFVFEVENDNDLKFKLDNMLMEYSKDNKVSATFDVLSMEVLF